MARFYFDFWICFLSHPEEWCKKKLLHRDAKQIDNVPHVSILGGSTSTMDMVTKDSKKVGKFAIPMAWFTWLAAWFTWLVAWFTWLVERREVVNYHLEFDKGSHCEHERCFSFTMDGLPKLAGRSSDKNACVDWWNKSTVPCPFRCERFLFFLSCGKGLEGVGSLQLLHFRAQKANEIRAFKDPKYVSIISTGTNRGIGFGG